MDLLKTLFIKKDDPQKWVKYYDLETSKYYDYIIDIFPTHKNILEIGSGGGVFYSKHKDTLVRLKNKYTCIDIDEPSIRYSKSICKYVNFMVKDVHAITNKELGKYDMLLLVQSYIVIPGIDNVFRTYFKSNPKGCIMMVNTCFPQGIKEYARYAKSHLLPLLFNNDTIKGKALTLNDIDELGELLGRHITNTYIGPALSGFDEYLTIIR